MKVVDLTHESFAERVSDFQQYPNGWVFKGNRPCIVDFMLRGVFIVKDYPLFLMNWQ